MPRKPIVVNFVAVCFFASVAGTLVFGQDVPLKNWPVNTIWQPSPSTTLGVKRVEGLVGAPIVFQPVDPCRLVDTRNPNGTYGGPSLAHNSTRAFPFGTSGSNTFTCSPTNLTIPTTVVAFSLNFTILNSTNGGGFITAYPTGQSTPQVSNLNWIGTDTQRGNMAIVPGDSNGSITIFTNNPAGNVNLIIDINGIFVSTLPGTSSFTITTPSGSTQPAIVGVNNSTAANAYGVQGQVSSGAAAGSAGVYGQNASAITGTAGVKGLSTGTSGTTYGVLGQTSSTGLDSAGVRGVDGTGAPTGATSFAPSGLRGESTSSFGVLGIAASASAAAGVEGVLVNSSGSTIANGRLGFSSGGTNYGVFAQTGDIGATGTKSFVVPHPTDPGVVIRYISMEGPEVGTYFRGRARVEDRDAVIDVPESFRLVTEDQGLSIQVTPIGRAGSLWVQEIGLDRIVVRGPRGTEFFYTVNGVRKGYASFEPIARGGEFIPSSASAHLPEGLSPETKRRLIANGTYNPDGTVNIETAERMGWTKAWAASAASQNSSVR